MFAWHLFHRWIMVVAAVTSTAALSIFAFYTTMGMLDIALLTAVLAWLLFWWKNPRLTRNKAVLLGILIGLASSIKYPFPTMGLMIVWTFWSYRKDKWLLILTAIAATATYLSFYSVYFFHGHTLVDWIKFEWFVYHWQSGRPILKTLIFNTLTVGRYNAWWAQNTWEIATNYTIAWPIIWLSSLLGWWRGRKNTLIRRMALYSHTLFLLYAIGSATSERYLIQVFPFWILLALYGWKSLLFSRQKRSQ